MSSDTLPLGKDRLAAVDGLRALAATMVYVYHVWQFCGSPALSFNINESQIGLGTSINTFPAGVDLFMVLSGFCLFWPIAKRPEIATEWSWRNYAIRRARRIIPPYYASLVFVTLLPVALVICYRILGQPAKWQTPPSLWQYLTHVFFIHTWFPSTWDGIQGVYWSLGLEVQFYLVFPLVVWSFRRTGIFVVVWMIVASVAYRTIVSLLTIGKPWTVEFLLGASFLGRWTEFASGMIAAWIVAHRQTRPFGAIAGTAMLTGGILMYAFAVGPIARLDPHIPVYDLLLSVAFGSLLVSLCVSQTPMRALFANRAVAGLGLMSYSLFLIHQNLAFYISEGLEKALGLHGAAEFYVMVTIMFALVIIAAWVLFRLVERPFLAARSPLLVERYSVPAVRLQPVRLTSETIPLTGHESNPDQHAHSTNVMTLPTAIDGGVAQ